MHIYYLSSNYGIRTLGAEAYRFVDFLQNEKQRIGDTIPIGTIIYGILLINHFQLLLEIHIFLYFIDLDFLIEEKLLTEGEVKVYLGGWTKKVDYALM